MDIFASSFKTLKNRTTELRSQLSKEFFKGDGQQRWDYEAETIPISSDGPVLIQYVVQNGTAADREGSVFMLPPEASSGSVTVGTVKAFFPVPGNFHFRFKKSTLDGSFNGYVWVDASCDDELVPQYAGGISMKALRLPGDGRVPRSPGVSAPDRINAPVPSSPDRIPRPPSTLDTTTLDEPTPAFMPESRDLFTSQPRARPQPSRIDSELPAHQPAMANTAPPVQHEVPAPQFEAQFPEPLPEQLAAPSAVPVVAPAKAAPPPPPPVPAMPADLMFDDEPAPPSEAAKPHVASATPAPPPPVAKQFNRDQLVAQREENVKKQVEQAQQVNEQRRREEEQLKASKLEASNKLCRELDAWAKTPDGTSFKDIRTVLSTVHEVLWPESEWKPMALSELIQDGAIKKAYRKAIIVVHPDKMKDAADPDTQVRADRIFQALNESWKTYTATESA